MHYRLARVAALCVWGAIHSAPVAEPTLAPPLPFRITPETIETFLIKRANLQHMLATENYDLAQKGADGTTQRARITRECEKLYDVLDSGIPVNRTAIYRDLMIKERARHEFVRAYAYARWFLDRHEAGEKVEPNTLKDAKIIMAHCGILVTFLPPLD